jgi:hypothetical protein
MELTLEGQVFEEMGCPGSPSVDARAGINPDADCGGLCGSEGLSRDSQAIVERRDLCRRVRNLDRKRPRRPHELEERQTPRASVSTMRPSEKPGRSRRETKMLEPEEREKKVEKDVQRSVLAAQAHALVPERQRSGLPWMLGRLGATQTRGEERRAERVGSRPMTDGDFDCLALAAV